MACRPLPPVSDIFTAAQNTALTSQASAKKLAVPMLKGKVMGFDQENFEKAVNEGTAETISEFEDWLLVVFNDFRNEKTAAFIFQSEETPGNSVATKRALRFNDVIGRFVDKFPRLGTFLVPPAERAVQ